jgi:hypothetical protein
VDSLPIAIAPRQAWWRTRSALDAYAMARGSANAEREAGEKSEACRMRLIVMDLLSARAFTCPPAMTWAPGPGRPSAR